MKKLKTNLFLINSLIVTLIIGLSTAFFLNRLHGEAMELARTEQQEALKTLWQLLRSKGSDFRIVDGKLMAGDSVINGRNELPDQISEIFGGTATIFMGDVGVATDVVTPDGRRALGTKLQGAPYQAVFQDKVTFRGEAPILGIPYFTAYDPIRDPSGKVIGALFVGVRQSEFLNHFHHLKPNVVAGSVLIELLLLASGFFLLRERDGYAGRFRELADDLQAQVSFLQELIDTIPSPIFYKDRNGRYLGHNKAFAEYQGLSKEQIVGRTVYDIAPRDLAERYREMDNELFENPGVQVYEASFRHADGSRHEVIFNKATFTRNGEPAGLVGVMMDVTERNRAEATLAEREEFLSCIIDSIQDGICILDPELNIVRANTVTERRFSARMPLLGRRCYEAYHCRMEPCQPCPSLETLASGVPSRKVFSPGDSGENWLEISAFPLFNSEKSRVTGVIEYIRDVTDSKRAEDALRESEERFHQLFVQNFEAIILFGPEDLQVMHANPRAEELTGYSLHELQGLQASAIIGELDFAHLTDSGSGEDVGSYQLEKGICRRKDGSTIFISTWSKIIRLRDRLVVYCSMRDITEKKRLEREVRSSQAKLIHANKMASLGLLASSVGHEINNPNNCISINAKLLTDVWSDAEPVLQRVHDQEGTFPLRGVPYQQMREFVPQLFNGITESSRRIATIVSNMKDWVREDKSGLDGSIDVNKLVQGASSILWHHIQSHTDNYRLALEDQLPAARGNGQQIEQVVINLVVNALQALPQKRCAVSVGTSFHEESGEILITVRDEGVGIGKEELKRLQEPFFTTKDGGTGLGLYISAAIVKEHRGRLEFESAPGQGTTVTVRIPQRRE